MPSLSVHKGGSIRKEPVSASDALKVVRLHVGAGQGVPEHHSNVDVVVTVVRGHGRFTVEGQAHDLVPGAVIVMPPKAKHSIAATSDLELVVVHARLAGAGAAPSCGA
jgi:quercetin dioxygenase-like cupin family protein